MSKLGKTIEDTDATIFGDLRIVIVATFIMIVIVSFIVPDQINWMIGVTLDFFLSFVYVVLGLLIMILWIIFVIINFFLSLINASIFDENIWRAEQISNLEQFVESLRQLFIDLLT